MLRVLKARENLAYQLALLSSELREIFQHAPPIPSADKDAESSDGNRKPIEGECPICYTEFEKNRGEIVYCRGACGNNVHKTCMQIGRLQTLAIPRVQYVVLFGPQRTYLLGRSILTRQRRRRGIRMSRPSLESRAPVTILHITNFG